MQALLKRPRRLVVLGMLFEGSLGVVAGLLGWALGQPFWERLVWSGKDAGLGVVVSLPMLAAFGACFWIPVRPLVRIKQFTLEVILPLFASWSVVELALLSALAGAGEEMLFRGVLQESFSDWLNPWSGLIAASLLFGFLHPFTPTYIVLAAGMGGYLGCVWRATGNLLVVIIAHGVYDFVVLSVLVQGRQKVSNQIGALNG